MRGRCWVELDSVGPRRIFKSWAAVVSSGIPLVRVTETARRDATAAIRQRVFERAAGNCEDCGKILTWGTMHMHEKIHRGDGGEISLDNSIAVCFNCHESIEHGNRRLRFNEPI